LTALALVLSREDRYAEAEKLARDSIDISRRVLGPENSSTAVHVYYLACIEARKENRSEALSLLRQALDHGLAISWGLGMDTFPDLTSLHGDPRFIAMVAEVKQRAAATKTPE
jgi:Tetratricopeptide repeat